MAGLLRGLAPLDLLWRLVALGLLRRLVTLGLLWGLLAPGLLWRLMTLGLLRGLMTLGLLWGLVTLGLLCGLAPPGLFLVLTGRGSSLLAASGRRLLLGIGFSAGLSTGNVLVLSLVGSHRWSCRSAFGGHPIRRVEILPPGR